MCLYSSYSYGYCNIHWSGRICPFTGKKANRANKVSHSNHKTKKLQFVNLQYKRVWWEGGKRYLKLRLSTKALKTIEKNGLDAVAKKAGIDLRKEWDEGTRSASLYEVCTLLLIWFLFCFVIICFVLKDRLSKICHFSIFACVVFFFVLSFFLSFFLKKKRSFLLTIELVIGVVSLFFLLWLRHLSYSSHPIRIFMPDCFHLAHLFLFTCQFTVTYLQQINIFIHESGIACG